MVTMFRQNSRSEEPFRAIAQSITAHNTPSDLILVHSIPSGVLGMARVQRQEFGHWRVGGAAGATPGAGVDPKSRSWAIACFLCFGTSAG